MRLIARPILGVLTLALLAAAVVVAIFGVVAAGNAFGRYQAIQNAENQVHINEIVIAQQEQLIQVEIKRASIRVEEANGIAHAQEIINATLTDRYLQHEAIKAQEKMVGSPNHTTVYLPTGAMGVPLVQTVNPDGR